MQITYRLTEQDTLEGQKAYYEGSGGLRRIAHPVFRWVLGLVVLGLSLYLAVFSENGVRILAIVLAAMSIFFIFAAPLVRKLSVKRYFRKNPNLQKEFRVDVSDRGIECWAEDLHTQVGWSNFLRWQESERIFLLYNNARIYSIFPKRAFAPADVDAFRTVLSQKIPQR